ncbi:T9SS type A sorting domain-containing protein [Pontibacter russatus]|uniref:T9SS type A sorting domain-containing protein n=1 Tax=Pontibacter russatus TaxID=2694929 RepID=UPI00137B3D19|nr:T9SS type A sorting domain-containing protein [Pontibacter russatus]
MKKNLPHSLSIVSLHALSQQSSCFRLFAVCLLLLLQQQFALAAPPAAPEGGRAGQTPGAASGLHAGVGNVYTAGINAAAPTPAGKGDFEAYFPELNNVPTAGTVSVQWDKTIGGNKGDVLFSLQQTSDGGYILGGRSESSASGDKTGASRGTTDYWVVKLNAAGQKEWDKTFGGSDIDILSSIQQTSDGGYILGGYSHSGISGDKTEASKGACYPDDEGNPACSTDYWVVKVDAAGEKQWDRTYGGSGYDYLISLQQTSDGGYILGGYSDSPVSGDKTEANEGSYDYWVVKLDAAGEKEWDRNYGGSVTDRLRSLQQTSDGGYILGGTTSPLYSGEKSEASRGGSDYWVVKVDANGDKEWDRTYGGSNNDGLQSLQQTSDGGYILGGFSASPISGEKSEANKSLCSESWCTDYWVVKVDASGDKEWDRTYGGSEHDNLYSLQQTSDGGYILGGTSISPVSGDKTEASKGSSDYWVVKVDASGDKEWDRTYGGNGYESLESVQQTSEGGYIIGGTSVSGSSGDKTEPSRGDYDFWVVKLKVDSPPPVTAAWDRRYGGSGTDRFTVVVPTPGGYLAGGYSSSAVSGDKSQGSRGGYDFWIVRTDRDGQKIWDRRYGGPSDDYLNRIIPTLDGGFLLAGSSRSGQGGDKSQPSRGSQDFWIVKISATGEKQWDRTFGGSGLDDLRKASQLPSGEYLLAGTSDSPSSGDRSQGRRGGNDFWVLKLSGGGDKLWDRRYGGSENEELESFMKAPGGGFLLGGSSASGISGDKSQESRGGRDFWAVRIDGDGNRLWDRGFGGSADEDLYSMGRNANGDFFLAGHSTSGAGGDKSQGSQGGKDFWMLLVSDSGEKLWDRRFGGSADEELRSIIQSHDGGYLLAGKSFSGARGDKSEASRGASDYWIVKTDAEGNREWDKTFGGPGAEELRYLLRTGGGGYLLGGRSDSGAGGDKSQPSQGGTDYWLVQVSPSGDTPLAQTLALEAEGFLEQAGLAAYPNPFQDKIAIRFSLEQTQAAELKVYDSQGREVAVLFQGEAQAGKAYQVEWRPTERQAGGMYFLRLHSALETSSQKIILKK